MRRQPKKLSNNIATVLYALIKPASGCKMALLLRDGSALTRSIRQPS